MHHLDRVEFLGVPLDNLTLQESVDCIDQRIKANDFLQHVVVNVAKLVNARVDRELLDSIKSSDLINIDGMGVVYGAKLLGIDINERVAGIDMFASLLDLSSKNAYRVFFYALQMRYYQKHKSYTNQINYMRWSQSWMFAALSYYVAKDL